jgi:hypothetical protein
LDCAALFTVIFWRYSEFKRNLPDAQGLGVRVRGGAADKNI